MRIPLTRSKKKPQARLRRQPARGRRRTFHEAIPVKAGQHGRRTRAPIAAPARRRTEQAPIRERNSAPALAPTLQPALRQAFGARWWVLLILFSLMGVVAYASANERFFVYEASIVGARHLDSQAIYSASGVDKQSIFWINPQRVVDGIASIPGIKAVRVRVGLPASVAIQVEEREPVILWRCESQKRDWWLDADGMVLPYHGDATAAGTVFVWDYSDRQLEAGRQIQPADLASSVLQMAKSLTGVQVFFYDASRGFYFTQRGPSGEWPVYVGDSEDLARKIQVTELLRRHFEESNVRPTYVDVRWAGRPVYGLPSGGDAAGRN